MDILKAIRTSGRKGKELTSFVSALFEAESPSPQDFAQAIALGKEAERGACVEALEYLTQSDPRAAGAYLACVINCLSDKAPRVRWEAARVLANSSSSFSEEIEPAIPGLIKNTADAGTVVRWSAAFALGEIAKGNPALRNELAGKLKTLSENEGNNGVRNVYLKALKRLKSDF